MIKSSQNCLDMLEKQAEIPELPAGCIRQAINQ